MDYAEVGKRIASCRIRQRLTQEDLSELSGVSIPHISNIETVKQKLRWIRWLGSLTRYMCLPIIYYAVVLTRHSPFRIRKLRSC